MVERNGHIKICYKKWRIGTNYQISPSEVRQKYAKKEFLCAGQYLGEKSQLYDSKPPANKSKQRRAES
jgi:hypothetical protein